MSALPNEQPAMRPNDEIIRAQNVLRQANIHWGEEVGAYEAEIHDINSVRARAAAERAEKAGRNIDELLGNIKRQPQGDALVSPKGIFRALGKILGH